MTYIPNSGALAPEFTLAADWTNTGTITVSYPTGFVQGDFTAGLAVPNKSFIVVNRNDKYLEDTTGVALITFSFGASLVTLTNKTGATIPAGSVISCWLDQQDGNSAETFAFPLDLASLANGDVVVAFRPGVDGYVENAEVIVSKPATTAAKLATLTPKIGAVATTGGVLALTSANMTPVGARVAGTQVTALNRIRKSDSLTITASAVTAFAEGTATLFVRIRRDTL